MKSEERKKEFGEVFTPSVIINFMLDKFTSELWKKADKIWLDSTCGNGNFLVEIKCRLVEAGHSKGHILENMIFGVDIMSDNCQECIEKLYGPGKIEELSRDDKDFPKEFKNHGVKHVYKHNGKLVRNIVCADGLKYDYSFGEKDVLIDWGE